MNRLKKPIQKIIISSLICISILLPYSTIVSASSLYKAGVLVDADTMKVLNSKDKDMILAQASVTKLMTYLVVMDSLKAASIPLNTKIVVNLDLSVIPSDGSKLNLKNGDQITLNQLIESLLIISANDSAIILEDFVSKITKKDFITLMNDKSKEIGLNKTKFVNTSGLTEKDKTFNTTTAYEIAILSKKIIDNYPQTLKITSKKSFTYNGLTYPATNKLLSKNIGVDGLKTGFTNEAGYCLASTVEIKPVAKDEKPYRVIAVSLGSKSEDERFNASLSLINYAKSNFAKKRIINKASIYNLESEYHVGGVIKASPSREEYQLINKKSPIESKVMIMEDLKGNIKKGDTVGKIIVTYDKTSTEADLIATEDVRRVSVFKRIGLFFKNLFK